MVIFAGDLRQLPVVVSNHRLPYDDCHFAKSLYFRNAVKMRLSENMRAVSQRPFQEFILRVGNGVNETTGAFEEVVRLNPE